MLSLAVVAGSCVSCGGTNAPRVAGEASALDASTASARDAARDVDDASADVARAPEDASTQDDAGGDAADTHHSALDAGSDAAAVADADPRPLDSSAPPDADAGGSGACNAVANDGPIVAETQIATSPPAPQGGTVVPGRYHLTAWEIYTGASGATGPTGNTRQLTMSFGASSYDEVLTDNGGAAQRATRTWSTSGTLFSSEQLCPSVDALSDDYTASGDVLNLIAYGVVFTLTRQ